MTTRLVGWSIRAFFFAVVGVLTFILQPPGATADRIFAKTGSRDRAAAISYAHRHHIG